VTVQIVEPRVGYDYEQAGVMLSVSGKTVQRLVEDGEIEAHYIGPSRTQPRIHREELDRYLLACPTERAAS
jgi:excisionase family DNA binding protein